MIRTEGLTKRFADDLAVDGLTLQVERGEVFAFLGPNGAGRTTTVRMPTALIAPSGGRAWVNGYESEGWYHPGPAGTATGSNGVRMR